MSEHISVFKKETIENLKVQDGGTYVDLTLGGGGHTREIWNLMTTGTLVAFDVDAAAITAFSDDITPVDGKTLRLVNRSFSDLTAVLAELEIKQVDGIIADLGWSQDQLSSIPGLAYDTEEPTELDMRLDKSMQAQAKDLLNGLYKPELQNLFAKYADIEGGEGRRLVDAILQFRQRQPVATNQDLLKIIDSTLPSAMRGSRNNGSRALSARVFQALRIAVNDELSRLQSVLPQSWNALKAGGILEVITFHSGEDRIVKQQCAKWIAEGKAENLYGKEEFLRPSVEELRQNLRARSAKLRGIIKK